MLQLATISRNKFNFMSTMRAIEAAGRRRRFLQNQLSEASEDVAKSWLTAELNGDALVYSAECALAANELSTSIALFDRAEPLIGDRDRCAGGRWLAHILQGDFELAWREHDAIQERKKLDPKCFVRDERLQRKRLIVRSLHGYGDAVQMLRFVPQLRQQVAELTIEVPPRLLEVAACFNGVDRIITPNDMATHDHRAWDVELEMLELPYALRVTTANLQPAQGYLQLPLKVRARVCDTIGARRLPRVGLVWSAGDWDSSRSIQFETMLPLLHVKGVEFWSLQGEPEHSAWLAQHRGAYCRDVYESGDGIAALAATIEQMDLVISVDTLAAHLAGALGVRCWLLLQSIADWRWMTTGSRSPWYPSLRLWRQQARDDWAQLIHDVCQALEAWTVRQHDQQGELQKPGRSLE